jgi:deoxyxylulose-5-phosphate synthase
MYLNLKSRVCILFGKHHAAGIACFGCQPTATIYAVFDSGSIDKIFHGKLAIF